MISLLEEYLYLFIFCTVFWLHLQSKRGKLYCTKHPVWEQIRFVVFRVLPVCVRVCYLVYPERDVSEASLLRGIFHQLPVHGPELVKLI